MADTWAECERAKARSTTLSNRLRGQGRRVMTKLRVGLLFGGRSVEHEVSVASASSIFRALDPARYEVRLVAIDQDGRWHLAPPSLPPPSSMTGREARSARAGRWHPAPPSPPPQSSMTGREVRLPAVPGERSLVGVGGEAAVTGFDVRFSILARGGGGAG